MLSRESPENDVVEHGRTHVRRVAEVAHPLRQLTMPDQRVALDFHAVLRREAKSFTRGQGDVRSPAARCLAARTSSSRAPIHGKTARAVAAGGRATRAATASRRPPRLEAASARTKALGPSIQLTFGAFWCTNVPWVFMEESMSFNNCFWVGVLALCVACSGNDDTSAGGSGGSSSNAAGSGGTSAGGGSGTAGTAGAVSDTALFVPAIPDTYGGTMADPGMKVIAHTIREGSLGPEWLVAIQNTGTLELCAIDIDSTFYDAQQVELASAMQLVDTPLHRGSSGQGGLVQCLGPGQIGMAIDTTVLADVDTTRIASVSYDFGAINLTDGVPTNDIAVTGVTTSDDGFGGRVFSGQVVNNSTTAVTNPSIAIYVVNAPGRPLAETEAIQLTTIAAGGSWTFKTTTGITEPYDHFVAFPAVSD